MLHLAWVPNGRHGSMHQQNQFLVTIQNIQKSGDAERSQNPAHLNQGTK